MLSLILEKKVLEYRLTEIMFWDGVKGFGKEAKPQ